MVCAFSFSFFAPGPEWSVCPWPALHRWLGFDEPWNYWSFQKWDWNFWKSSTFNVKLWMVGAGEGEWIRFRVFFFVSLFLKSFSCHHRPYNQIEICIIQLLISHGICFIFAPFDFRWPGSFYISTFKPCCKNKNNWMKRNDAQVHK